MRNVRLLAALLASVCVVSTALSQVEPPKDFYVPPVPVRECTDAADGVVSPTDGRLDLPDGNGTIEFWLTPGWRSKAARKPMYFVLGHNRYAVNVPPAIPGTSTPAKPADAQPDPQPADDPDADVIGGKPSAAPAAPGGADPAGRTVPEGAGGVSDPVYAPHYAIYLSEDAMFVQIGRKIWRERLSEEVIEKLAKRQRVHFVVTFERNVVVYADGVQCAKFVGLRLPGATTDHALGIGAKRRASGGKSVLVGGAPSLTERDTAALFEAGDERPIVDEPIVMKNEVRALNGQIGGVRIWSRAFPAVFFDAMTGVLVKRGEEDVFRSMEFPSPVGSDDAPRFADLIAYSRFESTNKAAQHILIQYPVSGRWLNDQRTETYPAAKPAPGLEDPYGNVDDYPVISILPSNTDGHFYVYQDSNLIGILRPGSSPSIFEFTREPDGRPMGITVEISENGKLDVRMSEPLALFGGDREGNPTSRVTLIRPSLNWTGLAVDPGTGFFTQGFQKYYRTAYRAFDITKMDPLRAYEGGQTGSNMEIFKEPTSKEFFLDMNAGGSVVAFGFRYVGIDKGNANATASIVTDAAQLSETISQHTGQNIDHEMPTGPNITKSIREGSSSASESFSKTSNALSVAKTFNKDYMITVNKATARLSPSLKSDIMRLRAAQAKGAPELEKECDWFIGRWGTHYSLATTFGGMMLFTRRVTEEDVRTATATGTSMEKSLKWGVSSKASVNILGLLNVEGGFKFSKEDSEGNSKETKSMAERLTNNSETTIVTLPAGQTLGSAMNDSGSHGYSHPVPIFFDLRPISELLSPVHFDDPVIYHEIRQTLRSKTKEYIAARGAKMSSGENRNDITYQTKGEKFTLWISSFYKYDLNFKGLVRAYIGDTPNSRYSIHPTPTSSDGQFRASNLDFDGRRRDDYTTWHESEKVEYDIVPPGDDGSEAYGANGAHRYELKNVFVQALLAEDGQAGRDNIKYAQLDLDKGTLHPNGSWQYVLKFEDQKASVNVWLTRTPLKPKTIPRPQFGSKLDEYRAYISGRSNMPIPDRGAFQSVIPVTPVANLRPEKPPATIPPPTPAPRQPQEPSDEQLKQAIDQIESMIKLHPAMAEVGADGTVVLSWTAQPGATEYSIIRSRYPGSMKPGETPGTARLSAAQASLKDKPPSGKWVYRVFTGNGPGKRGTAIGVTVVTTP